MQTNCRNPVSILVFIPSSYSIGDFPDVGEGRNPVSILVFIPSIRFGAGTMIHVQWSQSSINPGFHSENSFYNAQRLGWQRSQSSINPGFHSEYMDVGLADYSFELSQSSINPGFHSEQQRLYPPHPTP